MTRIGVCIVNFESADDTALAVRSLRGGYGGAELDIVVVDNTPGPQSLQKLIGAFETEVGDLPVPDGVHLFRGSVSPAEGRPGTASPDRAVTLIKAPGNDGFASGTNIGLSWLLERQTDIFVCLNPDTLVDQGAIRALADHLSRHPGTGLAGASLVTLSDPPTLQARGGARLSPLTLLGRNADEGQAPDAPVSDDPLDYPVGAAMACRRDYLEKMGLLDDRYFLYYEEADWARAGRDTYRVDAVPDAVVHHRHGGAAGSNMGRQTRSPLADYHMIRSRLLYAAKWHPLRVPLIWGLGWVQVLRRLPRRQWAQAAAMARANLGLPLAPALAVAATPEAGLFGAGTGLT